MSIGNELTLEQKFDLQALAINKLNEEVRALTKNNDEMQFALNVSESLIVGITTHLGFSGEQFASLVDIAVASVRDHHAEAKAKEKMKDGIEKAIAEALGMLGKDANKYEMIPADSDFGKRMMAFLEERGLDASAVLAKVTVKDGKVNGVELMDKDGNELNPAEIPENIKEQVDRVIDTVRMNSAE